VSFLSYLISSLVWLLRNDIGDEYESLLQKLSHLAPLADIQVSLSVEAEPFLSNIHATGGGAIITRKTDAPRRV
jgi:hypothetical protein